MRPPVWLLGCHLLLVAQSPPYIATEKKTPLRSHGNTLVSTNATCLGLLPMVQSVDESSVMRGSRPSIEGMRIPGAWRTVSMKGKGRCPLFR
ncbi:hypothetical protein AVEN_123036-1 [Araneus ventricosus]|uniref:Secreted protein n=1 Tax=Araneus ventricosus TaxID=182803 RepID=A0A4Y2KEV1_ARAVE|nr:hypothetical protein AVEN_123036-1 [Araneus ventricosus]